MRNYHVGVRVARCLQNAEHAVDTAMLETNALIQAMVEGRKSAGLAAEVGQKALSDAVYGLKELVDARARVVATHQELAVVAQSENLGWRMDGPLERKVEPTAVLPMKAA